MFLVTSFFEGLGDIDIPVDCLSYGCVMCIVEDLVSVNLANVKQSLVTLVANDIVAVLTVSCGLVATLQM